MKSERMKKTVCFAVLTFICLIWVFPMLWAFLTSFKSEHEIQSMGFHLWPREWTIENYTRLLVDNESSPVLKWFINSMIISVGHMLLVLVVISLAAYGFTRLKFKYRDKLFGFVLATMMLPGVLNLIPNFKIVDTLGWTNTFLAVIVPGAASVYNLFLVKQFMEGIPKELDESAVVDGASKFQIFWYIILPLSKPVLTVVALFSFTGAWNDFLWPSIVMTDIDKLPITPGLQLLQGQYMTYPGVGTAGAMLALIPTFLLYLAAQKNFMQSMALNSGIK